MDEQDFRKLCHGYLLQYPKTCFDWADYGADFKEYILSIDAFAEMPFLPELRAVLNLGLEASESKIRETYTDNAIATYNVINNGADFVFNPVADIRQFKLSDPVEVAEGGTGFMLITRDALERYRDTYPELSYKPDHVRTDKFDGTREIHAFFDCIINDQNRYLSEDYMFSEYCRNLGMDIWALPMIELMHCGSYIFQGSIARMAQADVHATVDEETIKKMQKAKAEKAQKNSS